MSCCLQPGNPSFSHGQVNIESPPPLLSTESTQETWKTNPEYPDIGWDYPDVALFQDLNLNARQIVWQIILSFLSGIYFLLSIFPAILNFN